MDGNPMTREESMLDTAHWLLDEDAKAEESGEGWDDTVDMAVAGLDLASMIVAYFEEMKNDGSM